MPPKNLKPSDDPAQQPRQKNIVVTIGEYSAIGFILPSCIVVGWLFGGWLDRQFGTTYLYMVFLLLGIVAGFIQIIRFVNKKNV